jgi:MFS family permease
LLAVIYAGQLLVQLAPSLQEYSGLGVAFFAGCMAIVRIFGDRLRSAFGDQACLGTSLALSIVGYAILSFAPNFVISVLAYALVGTGLSFLSPIMFPLVGRLAPAQRSSAMGLAFATSNVYRFVTPAIVGLLVTWYGLNIVFAVCTVFGIGALALGLMSLHLTKNTRGAANAAPLVLDNQKA